MKIGVIAEEQDDIDVLYEFTCKLTAESNFSFSKFVSHGCGKLRRKCSAWSRNLMTRGCHLLVVMHDLDEYDVACLRQELEESIRDANYTDKIILIPKYEIEAWLIADPLALKHTFNMNRTPNLPAHPETIQHPKEYIRDIVWTYCKKHYVNTIHNGKIAQATRIEKLSICPSFSRYPQFIARNANN